jgi:hypothetical protein
MKSNFECADVLTILTYDNDVIQNIIEWIHNSPKITIFWYLEIYIEVYDKIYFLLQMLEFADTMWYRHRVAAY